MLRVVIEFNSDFHIGSGLGKAGYIDSLFVKDSQGNPVIPGQTLKGIIRDSCLRIAHSLNISCKKIRKCNCPVCRIFGRESQPGKYIFSPAQAEEKNNSEEYPVRRRTAINKETGTAKEKALFSTEVAPRGREFEFTIRKRNLKEEDNLEKTLLIAGILWTREIGGHRRRGLGHCRLTILEPQIEKENLKKGLRELKGKSGG